MSNRKREIRPQPGYQEKALSSPADIVIGGAAAGVGKSYCLLMEPLRHLQNPGFGAVCFRRTSPQIRAQGGLWDTSEQIYPLVGGRPRESFLDWEWQSGAKVSFRHLQHEADKMQWQGSQIPLILWDELTHFSESMFFYLLTRNRSECGVKPYVRATCNPDPESWVATLISWWIDPESGFTIPEREGVLRYFTKQGDDYIWGDTFEQVKEQAWHFIEPLTKEYNVGPEVFIKSLTFISGRLADNQALLSRDPSYLANLLAQDEQTVLQLLKGNWKVVISELDIYDYAAFTGLFSNVRSVNENGRYLTADIAGQGSDLFVVGAWHGNRLADLEVMAKSNGPEVVGAISGMARRHSVPNHHILYDADGIGALMEGFIPGAVSFHGGSRPLETRDDAGRVKPENYKNLKTQCYYRSGFRVAKGEYAVAGEVATRMYDRKMTVRQRFMHERKAIKREKPDTDGKLQILPKADMKVKLGGESPDLLDMFMMREYFELRPKPQIVEVY